MATGQAQIDAARNRRWCCSVGLVDSVKSAASVIADITAQAREVVTRYRL
jgi:hypothetical protein